MGSVLSLYHTSKQQTYHGNYSTLSDRYEEAVNTANRFEDQPISMLLITKLDSSLLAILILSFLISSIGMVGNGCVIWFLGFCIKKNNFTIYVLNLAIADFGVLMCMFVSSVFVVIVVLKKADVKHLWGLSNQLCSITYCVGLYLLTAISVERCLSILFPIWVRCHRPRYLSTTVSIVIWTFSTLIAVTEILLQYFQLLDICFKIIRFICGLNLFLFTPVMVVSTLILFIKLTCRHQPGKLHTVMLIILLFFIITAVPYSLFFFFTTTDYYLHVIAIPMYDLLIVLNSSINPIIYFFVGNQCNCRSWKSMKGTFQRVFKDETEHTEVS
ncbi:mas-related G-protein coupled receptor member H-like [Sceloporus undulatus]|uniref:mas-related G-protein coupled receptor member H-like n=1 Tax=Sceloporus undulatus TaxID=8520 RepID=UPI001C4BF85A|nr:mas-related G-protein coupled receptor member H-like [Sceloporus undulatus]